MSSLNPHNNPKMGAIVAEERFELRQFASSNHILSSECIWGFPPEEELPCGGQGQGIPGGDHACTKIEGELDSDCVKVFP